MKDDSEWPSRARSEGRQVPNSRGPWRSVVAVCWLTFVAGPDGVVVRHHLIAWSHRCAALIWWTEDMTNSARPPDTDGVQQDAEAAA
jgi:hypothetical protein